MAAVEHSAWPGALRREGACGASGRLATTCQASRQAIKQGNGEALDGVEASAKQSFDPPPVDVLRRSDGQDVRKDGLTARDGNGQV